MKAIYIDAFHGASGDMLLSSLLDYGLPISFLEDVIKRLGTYNIILNTTKSTRKGVHGTHLDVIIDHSETDIYRWQDFVNIVNNSDFSDYLKNKTTDIFKLIGEAEAEVHDTNVNEVRFHELGTLDTLFDVVGLIASLEELNIDKVYCSALPRGSGIINSSHGILSVPPPATLKILEMMNIPSFAPNTSQTPTGEMITPTGTAILGTIANFESPVMEISGSGCGLGTRDPDMYPNITRIHIGELKNSQFINKPLNSDLVLLETNVDDMSGEILGYLLERLLDMGVKDVWYTPIQMKKNRPGVLVSVLTEEALFTEIADLIFRETSTLGIRVRNIDRLEAGRRIEKFESSLGILDIKVKLSNGSVIAAYPEYEDCRKIALSQGIALLDVYNIIQAEIQDKF